MPLSNSLALVAAVYWLLVALAGGTATTATAAAAAVCNAVRRSNEGLATLARAGKAGRAA